MLGAQRVAQPSARDLARVRDEAGVEFLNGQIHEKPVSIRSKIVETQIVCLLMDVAAQAKSAQVFTASMGYRCFIDDPSKVRKPDVSIVRSVRLHGHNENESFIRVRPDLAIEIVSRSDLAAELQDRIQDYLTNGFPLIWVVYPSLKTVTIFRLDGMVATLHEKDEITGEPALPNFRCKVAQFFPEPAK